ncbi:hypothetical protein EHS13_13735 [Paenibacillus psychroresistens]|uniref:DUF7210 domain-containing protein n=1 Tax=Paenibacillus psychroresistens TaxID=1778678 RepID=A0A6B8RHY6_9BACL|nr:hypothetical protein [Paenibacillus psychroresistens]QGQ95860.1 hypothetical protein EHS13_13735 [Paenibacillus psychroresistens]
MAITSAWNIQHNGIKYPAGEVIDLLSEEEEQELIDKGKAKRVPVVYVTEDSFTLDGNSQNDSDILTIQQFSDLKADEQKAQLLLLGIDPASKLDLRVQQYTQWFLFSPLGDLDSTPLNQI